MPCALARLCFGALRKDYLEEEERTKERIIQTQLARDSAVEAHDAAARLKAIQAEHQILACMAPYGLDVNRGPNKWLVSFRCPLHPPQRITLKKRHTHTFALTRPGHEAVPQEERATKPACAFAPNRKLWRLVFQSQLLGFRDAGCILRAGERERESKRDLEREPVLTRN